jgi:hypothetical protein
MMILFVKPIIVYNKFNIYHIKNSLHNRDKSWVSYFAECCILNHKIGAKSEEPGYA